MPCNFFPSFFFYLFFFPRLISAVADWMSTILLHMVCSANLECMSEMCCTRLAGNTSPKKIAKNSQSAHHRTTLSGYIFATKACIDYRENLLNSNNHAMPCSRKQTARSKLNLLDLRVLNNVHNPSVANTQIKFKCRQTLDETTQ